jgi:hypothetical protein
MSTPAASDFPIYYVIIDRQTGRQVGAPYTSGKRASARVNKLDLDYGASRYSRRPVYAAQVA